MLLAVMLVASHSGSVLLPSHCDDILAVYATPLQHSTSSIPSSPLLDFRRMCRAA
jgi:hypothetical protein